MEEVREKTDPVSLVVVDEGLVQGEAPAAVHQVSPGASLQLLLPALSQLVGERALDARAGARLRTNHIDHLQVPLVARLHL